MMFPTYRVEDANALSLQLDSTLQELAGWNVDVEIHLPGSKVSSIFERESLLPGIILTDNKRFVGMISRQKFFEFMSRPYSYGLFSMRPIQSLYKFLQPEEFIYPANMLVTEATQAALQRSHQSVYEPILVKSASGDYKIVDFHQLLLASSHLNKTTAS
jgi:hypothetical protein